MATLLYLQIHGQYKCTFVSIGFIPKLGVWQTAYSLSVTSHRLENVDMYQ